MSKLIGVLFHPELEGARTLSHDLCALLEQTGHRTWSGLCMARRGRQGAPGGVGSNRKCGR